MQAWPWLGEPLDLHSSQDTAAGTPSGETAGRLKAGSGATGRWNSSSTPPGLLSAM